MAPRRRRRSKVGLGRMDAAVDAMRPMGFQAAAVRKSVKKLLKVYGDEGWMFIEEAAYKLLIDTMLEENETPLRICSKEATYDEPLETRSTTSHEQPASANQLSDKEAATCDQLEIHSGFQEVEGHKEIGREVGFARADDPQPVNKVPRPCYGWISDDDEGDQMVELPPSSSILADGLAA